MSRPTLRQAREKSGLTASQVAASAQCDRATLYRIEDGKTLPKRKTARLLFDLFEGAVALAAIYDPEYAVRDSKAA